MSEHYCKNCENGEDDMCKLTRATHTTGIECPSFVSKIEKMAAEKDIAVSMESYKSGATRTKCETKIDPEGFFSPLVMLRYSEYMHKCQVQADGTLRDSDNWQGGIPLWRYMKGKWRHFLDTWLMHRGYKKVTDEGLDLQDCLCAELFNTMGYLHEVLKEEKGVKGIDNVPAPGGAHKNFNEPPLIADQLAAEADEVGYVASMPLKADSSNTQCKDTCANYTGDGESNCVKEIHETEQDGDGGRVNQCDDWTAKKDRTAPTPKGY